MGSTRQNTAFETPMGPYDAIPAVASGAQVAEPDDARAVWLRGLAVRLVRRRRDGGYLRYMVNLADPAVLALYKGWLQRDKKRNPYGLPGDVERTLWELELLNDETLLALQAWAMEGEA